MENVKASSKKIMINYGLILGIVSILLSVVSYTLGSNMFQPHWSIQMIGFLILVVIIIMGLSQFKKLNNGYLKLSQALKVGIGITAVSAVLGAIYFAIFTSVVEPEYFELYKEFQREAAFNGNSSATPEQIEAGLAASEPFMNMGFFIGVQFVIGIFFGFIVSLIAGLIMKKENPYEDA